MGKRHVPQRFDRFEEALEHYLPHYSLPYAVVKWGRVGVVNLKDLGLQVRPHQGGYEAALGRVRVRTIPVWVGDRRNMLGDQGAVYEMFLLKEVGKLVREALRMMSDEEVEWHA